MIEARAAESGVGQPELRRCLARWATGVAVMTTTDRAGKPCGLTVNSFASVSLAPPLVLWSVARSARSFEAFVSSSGFVVNVLAERQYSLARRFATSGGPKFDGVDYARLASGMLALTGTAATLVCARHAVHEGGDHAIIEGRVLEAHMRPPPPLVFSDGHLRALGPPICAAGSGAPSAAIVLVGDELLTGQVHEANSTVVAARLREHGIQVAEIRVVADDRRAIAGAVSALSLSQDWVFICGGLGPTHDDVTAPAVAEALGVPLEVHVQAKQLLEQYHAPAPVPEGRLATTLLPASSIVIPDRISGTSGFRIENVIALPGVPDVLSWMLDNACAHLPQGRTLCESSLRAEVMEPDIAADLRAVQMRYPNVKIGCYPYFSSTVPSVNIVLRSLNRAALTACECDIRSVLDLAVSHAVAKRLNETALTKNGECTRATGSI
jgi:molybdenum cofactor synthesis domain-containing protein